MKLVVLQSKLVRYFNQRDLPSIESYSYAPSSALAALGGLQPGSYQVMVSVI